MSISRYISHGWMLVITVDGQDWFKNVFKKMNGNQLQIQLTRCDAYLARTCWYECQPMWKAHSCRELPSGLKRHLKICAGPLCFMCQSREETKQRNFILALGFSHTGNDTMRRLESLCWLSLNLPDHSFIIFAIGPPGLPVPEDSPTGLSAGW